MSDRDRNFAGTPRHVASFVRSAKLSGSAASGTSRLIRDVVSHITLSSGWPHPSHIGIDPLDLVS